MPRKKSNSVNVRVSFSGEAWERVERLAASMSMLPTELVRVMASLQLVQWEAMTTGRMIEAQKSGRGAELEAELHQEFERIVVPPKEDEERPVDRPGFRPGGKPRSLVELEAVSVPGSEWSGYLRGL